MDREEILKELYALKDVRYRDFQGGLIPSVPRERMIGVRTPDLKALAKKAGYDEPFLRDLPHEFFDEDQLHAFIVSGIRDFDLCLDETGRFLPYVDNWATCDQLNPKALGKNREGLLVKIREWISSGETYEMRFAVRMLMTHFLDEEYDDSYPAMVAGIRSDEYYVRMMQAWYFATALAKRYDEILPYIEERRLDPWTHNKAIQKAVESRRITDEQKVYLKSLKCDII